MKTPKSILLIPLCCIFFVELPAQSQQIKNKKDKTAETFTTREEVSLNFSQNQLQITNISVEESEKILVFNMRGAVVIQQNISNSPILLDLNNVDEGVYLLVIRPRGNGKERMMKFVVRH